jgi:hypothetical protein
VLELAADNWEAALGTALASSGQPCDSLRSPLGARRVAAHDGGWSQPEERHRLAAAVPRIARGRKSPVRGVFGKIPVPTIF